jgi:phospholipid/cholesterol/gamma-HCH transport system substrate-binding protein
MKRSLELAKMNTRVGLLSLGGFLILVWVLFFPVRGASFFSDKIKVTGYFDRVDSLRHSAPVYYRGTEVGSVVSVRIDENRTETPLVVVVEIERRITKIIPKGAEMDIVAQGLLGDVFVDIKADLRKPGEAQLADGDILPTQPYQSALAGMNDIAGQLKQTLDHVNALLAGVQGGKGTMGRLFNEDALYKELVGAVHELKAAAGRIGDIEQSVNTKLLDEHTKKAVDQAVASAQRLIDSADQMTAKAQAVKWHLSLGMEEYTNQLYGATVGLRIIPNNDRYYEGGVTYFNQGLTFTAQDNSLGGTGVMGYNAWLAWRVLGTPVFIRGGVKRSSVAAGLDFRLGDWVAWAPVEFTADIYRFGNVVSQLDLGASIAFLRDFRLTGGVEDLFNTPRYKMGLTLIYDDEDLTSILVKAKTGL